MEDAHLGVVYFLGRNKLVQPLCGTVVMFNGKKGPGMSNTFIKGSYFLYTTLLLNDNTYADHGIRG